MLDKIGAFLENNWLPATLASSAASVFSRRQAEASAARRRDAMLQAERMRQAQYQAQMQAALSRSLQAAAPEGMQDGMGQAMTFRQQAAADRPAPSSESIASGEFAGVSQQAPEVVKQAAARAILDALKKGKEYTQSQAQMKSYGDAAQRTGITMNRAGGDINTASMLSRNSVGALPAELASANRSGQGWGAAHDVFGGMSNIGMLYGMGAMNKQKPRPQTQPTGTPPAR